MSSLLVVEWCGWMFELVFKYYERMIYPIQAQELVRLLQEDQKDWRSFARAEFKTPDKIAVDEKKVFLKQRVLHRAQRMLTIINDIGEPSLANIGADAAQAMSILALHDSLNTLKTVLNAFTSIYIHDRGNTHYQAIPSMTDWVLILERKPQRFGTIWLFDNNETPFLPTVEDFEHVNDRRREYGIEALHWPRSLAIPESKQPWLKRPLSELVMRSPTDKEYNDFAHEMLNHHTDPG